MTPSNSSDDLINWNSSEDGVAEEFIVAANGRTARKYEGDYDDAQGVIEWVEKSGGSAELEDSDARWKKLYVTNPDGSVLELPPSQYLVVMFVSSSGVEQQGFRGWRGVRGARGVICGRIAS